MSARRVVVGLHWPNEDFGDSAAWEFDPGRVYRRASRRGRNPWGLWTSPKTSANGWNRCTAARELGIIGDHHWEITVDITGMLRLTAEQDVPAEFGWEVSELGFGLGGWEVDWRCVQDAGYSGLHVSRYRRSDDPQLWWAQLDCDCTVAWDLDAVLEVSGPFR
ncbi:hypothetical protein [Candidatus Poriferisodalis sp.]|uniref:hypothetical protein n=1 Tax=Candidatus Poriferisodalis sp. TaxID=3101277 RepID=UPI003B51EF62